MQQFEYAWWFREEAHVAWIHGAVGQSFKPAPPRALLSKQRKMNQKLWPSERHLRDACLSAGLSGFSQNHPVINRYWGDFVFKDSMVVLEADGSVHDTDKQRERDLRRDHLMTACGYLVFRIKYPYEPQDLDALLWKVGTAVEERAGLYERTVAAFVPSKRHNKKAWRKRLKKERRVVKKVKTKKIKKHFPKVESRRSMTEDNKRAVLDLKARQAKFAKDLAARQRAIRRMGLVR